MRSEDTCGSVWGPSAAGWATRLAGFGSSPPDEPLLPNPPKPTVIRQLGDFRVVEIHSGGMGEVFVCLRDQEGPQSPIALKTFLRKFQFDRASRRAFERECALWVRASIAPGIFPVYGIIDIDGRPFIGMPGLLQGVQGEISLRDLLRKGPLSGDQAIDFALVMAFALSCAGHVVPGLVHGDLKPENVLLWQDLPYISDFGLARAFGQHRRDSALMPSPAYCSPLARDPMAQLTVLDDIYSFGVMLEETVTGRLPKCKLRRSAVNYRQPAGDDASMELLELARLCHSENPERRPSDFRVIFDKLKALAPDSKSLQLGWTSDEAVIKRKLESIAFTLVQLQSYREALEVTDTIHRFKRSSNIWISRGLALSELGRPMAALRCYRAALRRSNAEDAETFKRDADRLLYIASGAYIRLGMPRRAAWILRRLSRASDASLTDAAIYSLASVYIELRRYRKAEWFIRKVQSYRDSADCWNQLGVIHLRLQEYEEAAEAYRNAIELASSNAQFYSGLGQALLGRRERVSDALIAFENAIGCGTVERRVFVCALTCAQLSADLQALLRLMDVTCQVFGQAELTSIIREASWLRSAVVNGKVPQFRQSWHDKRWDGR
jgi:serine/threonine protein kinase